MANDKRAFYNNTEIITTYILSKLIKILKRTLAKLEMWKISNESLNNLGNPLQQEGLNEGLNRIDVWDDYEDERLRIMNKQRLIDNKSSIWKNLTWEEIVEYFKQINK